MIPSSFSMNAIAVTAVAGLPTLPMLLHLVLVILVLGLIFALVWWALGYAPLPEPFAKIVRFLVILIFVVILISLLLPLLGVQL